MIRWTQCDRLNHSPQSSPLATHVRSLSQLQGTREAEAWPGCPLQELINWADLPTVA